MIDSPAFALVAALALAGGGARAATSAAAVPSPPSATVSPPACTLRVASDADLAAQGTFAGLAPGSTVCIAAGHYARQFVVAGTRGTAARPIAFVVRPVGAVAAFTAGALLRDVAFVTVTGLDVSQDPKVGPWAAVTLDKGSRHVGVHNFVVHDSFVGISIGSSEGGAGVGNDVSDNRVENNWNTGIAIADLSDGNAQEFNVVQRNHVSGNGGHGIEITDANYISIYDNTVSGNATGIHSVMQGGYSGIHLYASGPSAPGGARGVRCSHNVVGFNKVENTLGRPAAAACRDGSGSGHCTDGNGIQVDQFCSINEVFSNVSVGNSGAGISLYGATRNEVFGNYVAGNNQQPGRLMFFPGPAEITLHAINMPQGSASGNFVHDNVAITTVHKVPAFYESGNAGSNRIGPNNVWRWTKEADPGMFWAPVYIGKTWYGTAAEVDKATGTQGNVVGLAGP